MIFNHLMNIIRCFEKILRVFNYLLNSNISHFSILLFFVHSKQFFFRVSNHVHTCWALDKYVKKDSSIKKIFCALTSSLNLKIYQKLPLQACVQTHNSSISFGKNLKIIIRFWDTILRYWNLQKVYIPFREKLETKNH